MKTLKDVLGNQPLTQKQMKEMFDKTQFANMTMIRIIKLTLEKLEAASKWEDALRVIQTVENKDEFSEKEFQRTLVNWDIGLTQSMLLELNKMVDRFNRIVK